LAADRSGWRQQLNSSGKNHYIREWQAKKREERRKRHARIGRNNVIQEEEEEEEEKEETEVGGGERRQEVSGEIQGVAESSTPVEAMCLLLPSSSVKVSRKLRVHALRAARRRRRQIEEEEECVGENNFIIGE
jgi:hypothetical protein